MLAVCVPWPRPVPGRPTRPCPTHHSSCHLLQILMLLRERGSGWGRTHLRVVVGLRGDSGVTHNPRPSSSQARHCSVASMRTTALLAQKVTKWRPIRQGHILVYISILSRSFIYASLSVAAWQRTTASHCITSTECPLWHISIRNRLIIWYSYSITSIGI